LLKNTTKSFFSNSKSDLGIITSLFLTTAPILISLGRLESFIDLLINSEVSNISASINSYSPSKSV